ncbi:unnamed protein product [Calicophoron daubneyi]|uniref:Sulfide:quinone oxidoreductase, mitochondrial n=1 Tax=Calicophoron daubneyi TaxID=300641 RepID=A0AAV2TLW2_CALDB
MGLFKHSAFIVPLRELLRTYVVTSNIPQSEHHKILIVGGGTGGITMASRLSSKLPSGEVTVIEPSGIHYYQPLWTLVGAGIRTLDESRRPTSSLIPHGTTWIQDHVTKMEPEHSRLYLSNGKLLSYDYLILALGLTLRYDLVPGASEALEQDPRVCSNYSPKYVLKTFEAFKGFTKGHAVFTLPSGPIKCAGAPQKVMYLFEHYLRKTGKRDGAELEYFTAIPQMFSVNKYSRSLANICEKRNIKYNALHNLVNVNHKKSELEVEHVNTKERRTLTYDFLHITPPMSSPDVLKQTSKLTNPQASDYVDVDAHTLKHKLFNNIFAIGDCAALPTSKTAAAVSSQSKVLEENLLDMLNGGKGDIAKYDGYTACPLITSYNHGVLAEFAYDNVVMETSPFDQSKERAWHYFAKAVIMPTLYWDYLLKGRWSGPKTLRKLLHLGLCK